MINMRGRQFVNELKLLLLALVVVVVVVVVVVFIDSMTRLRRDAAGVRVPAGRSARRFLRIRIGVLEVRVSEDEDFVLLLLLFLLKPETALLEI